MCVLSRCSSTASKAHQYNASGGPGNAAAASMVSFLTTGKGDNVDWLADEGTAIGETLGAAGCKCKPATAVIPNSMLQDPLHG